MESDLCQLSQGWHLKSLVCMDTSKAKLLVNEHCFNAVNIYKLDLITFIYTIHTHLIFYKSLLFWRKKTNKILFRKQIYHFTFHTQNATIQLQMLETSEVIRIYNKKCYNYPLTKKKKEKDYPQI